MHNQDWLSMHSCLVAALCEIIFCKINVADTILLPAAADHHALPEEMQAGYTRPRSLAQSVTYFSTISPFGDCQSRAAVEELLGAAVQALANTPDSFDSLSDTVDMLMRLLPMEALRESVMNYITRWLGQPDRLTELLRHILASDKLVSEVSAQSYGHNNSFMKLVLFRTQEGRQLRVHARWPQPEGFKEDLAHNHRADFASYMVAGALHFDVLQECADSMHDVCTAYRYIDHRSNGKDKTLLLPLGPGLAKWTERNVPVTQGQSYHFDMNTLHRLVVPVGDIAGSLSIVLRNPRVRDYTTMLTAQERSSMVMPSIPPLAPSELRLLCNSIITTFLHRHGQT